MIRDAISLIRERISALKLIELSGAPLFRMRSARYSRFDPADINAPTASAVAADSVHPKCPCPVL